MSEADCPIRALYDGLHYRGVIELAWAVRWSAGGREPVAAAWAEARDPWAMRFLLEFAGRESDVARAMTALLALYDRRPREALGEAIAVFRPITPPTLQELIAERDRLRARHVAARR